MNKYTCNKNKIILTEETYSYLVYSLQNINAILLSTEFSLSKLNAEAK